MKSQLKTSKNKTIKGAELQALVFDLLASFPAKSQEIVKRRFGLLGGKKGETLEAIGKGFGITRERVRQIEAATLKAIKAGSAVRELAPFEEVLTAAIRKMGGVVAERELLKSILGEEYKNSAYRNLVLFVLNLSGKFFDLPENQNFKKAWTLKKGFFKKSQVIIDTAKSILKNIGEPVTFDQLYQEIDKSPVETSQYDANIIKNYLTLSKEVSPSLYQDWGLSTWNEINPRGVKDKAYIILKKEGKPLHFLKITELINESKMSKKGAHAPTVHNELIKDPRFVLVGRGVYALKDWGFREGTVKEIIEDILKRAKKGMPREKLVDLVLKQRLVRRSTVLLNLQDDSIFARNNRDEINLK